MKQCTSPHPTGAVPPLPTHHEGREPGNSRKNVVRARPSGRHFRGRSANPGQSLNKPPGIFASKLKQVVSFGPTCDYVWHLAIEFNPLAYAC